MGSLVPFWYIVIAVLWTGFFVLEGFDFGVGMLHGVVGTDEAGPPGGHQHDRAAVGRQRGLADRGRGRHVRRVPRLVRDDVLGLQPRAGPAAGLPDRPRCGLRIPRQARRGPLAPHLGCAAHRGQPAGPAADRRGPGRIAARTAHQLRPELHRLVLGPAPALRPVHRRHPGADLPAARRDVLVPEDHRRHARAVLAGGPPGGPLHRRRRHRLHHLDARHRQQALSSST